MGILCLFLLMQVAPLSQSASVMTFNIRNDNPNDGLSVWSNRTERVAQVMKQASIIGVQEALHNQVMDLEGRLDGYAWVGVGRTDGKQDGEYSPIFYRTDELELLDSDRFWLSETPAIPGSRSWDAAVTRIVTVGQFRWRASGDTLWVFNTHFDHRGETAREESAKLLMSRIDNVPRSHRLVVTGDFNAGPATPVYTTMTAGRVADTYLSSQAEPVGPEGTFSGFVARDDLPNRRIDYVFADSSLRVRSYEAIVDLEAGRYVSDHLPVNVLLEWGSAQD